MTPAATLAPPVGNPRGLLAGRLVRAELLKIRTTNTWWIFGICVVATTALSLLVNLVQANQDLDQLAALTKSGPPDTQGATPDQVAAVHQSFLEATDLARVLRVNAANIFTSGQYFGLLFVVILGALIVTNEFLHQTATTTFLVTPHRTQVIVSKFAAGAILAAGFWLLTTVLNLIAGSIFFSSSGYSVPLGEWPVLRSIVFNLLAYVIWAALGIGLGVLIRSQLGATISATVAYLLGLPVAGVFFFLINKYVIKEDWVFNGMLAVPSVASQVMVSSDRVALGPNSLGPPWWVGLLVLIGYGLIAGAIGTLITRRRDIS
jgi:ABC-2 type transport system permease protein